MTSTRRKIQAPGIELNEIDRSQYDNQTDYSLPNAPVCLMCGFTDKGENYTTKWINTKNTFIEQYGYPTNEAERYMYNGAMEILNKNGILLTSKLPYDNESKDRYPFVDYSVTGLHRMFDHDIDGMYSKLQEIKDTLVDLLNVIGLEYLKTDSILQMKEAIQRASKSERVSIEQIEKILGLADSLKKIVDFLNTHNYADVFINDNYLTSNCDVSFKRSGLMSIENLDELIINSQSVMKNTIKIVNISRNQFDKVDFDCVKYTLSSDESYHSNDILGIVPVVVTPTNALYFQHLLNDAFATDYNIVSGFTTVKTPSNVSVDISSDSFEKKLYMKYLSEDEVNEQTSEFILHGYDDYSYSREYARQFPLITYLDNGHFDNTYMKSICVVVLKAFVDHSNKDRINFEILEKFTGSLDKNEKNASNGSRFIDNIVNLNSKYIRLFSSVDKQIIKNAKIVSSRNQPLVSMGFFESQCIKNIDYTNSIIHPISRVLDRLKNTVETSIDLIVDAGVSNIGQYLTGVDATYATAMLDASNQPLRWYSIVKKFDDFCKYTRKDCMFLADGPRPFCLVGEQKIVRPTSIANTIDNSITPKIKFMTDLNSSYSAGYCDWFQAADDYSGDYFWIPPSIKAAGVYCYTDIYHHKWNAPAGMNRGVIDNVVDVAFSPTNDEAGRIYSQQWNYAVNYPIDGIVLEGQKTFLKNATALDRVNVRRLLLHLEKQTVRVAKRFLYENNTEYLRQLFVDTLKPIFEDAKNGWGINDYAIRCDSTNNTNETIDRNELHCTIAVKPVKVVEFIILNFIVTNQSASVTEEVSK